jgi:hypothetical protein
MMRASGLLVLILIGCCVPAVPASAQRQPPAKVDDFLAPAEVIVGVTSRLPAASAQSRALPDFGVALSAVGYLDRSFAVVGEISGETNHLLSALVGVRLRTVGLANNGRDRFRLFAQLLAGNQWSAGVPRRRTIQPGVGADDYLRKGLTLHVEYDYCYCWVPGAGRNLSTGRFFVGLGVPLGGT